MLVEFAVQQATQMRGGYFSFESRFIRSLPIAEPQDALADTIRSNVMTMFDLHKRLAAARTPDEKNSIQRRIDGTDGEIDRLVYELYGLTEDEIAIVETRL